MQRFDTKLDKVMIAFIYLILAVTFFITVYPFWDIVVLSMSSRKEALKMGFHLYTLKPDFTSYMQIFNSEEFWQSLYNSVVRLVAGTVLSVLLTAVTAYPLSKKNLPFNKFFTATIIFTMIFNGGMIPTYLLVKSLNMMNTIWALILPSAVAAFNLLIMRNFLRSIPESLEESAVIDGANELTVWLKIVLPLSKPALATIALWVAVAHWNAYFDALIYITDRSKYVLPILLRRILLENQQDMFLGMQDMSGVVIKPTEETVKSAIIVISTLPIVSVYPFLQKYFSQGIMLGAVKG